MGYNFLEKIRKMYFGIALAVLGVFFFASAAQAVQVKRVQSGEVYFDIDDIAQVVKLKVDVDPTKAFVLLYSNVDYPGATAVQNTLISADFGSPSELIIARDAASYSVTVRYYVVEFTDGVNVLRGISSFASGSYSNPQYTTKTISLPSTLNSANDAFPIVQARCALAQGDHY
jgi:hypothetical protein